MTKWEERGSGGHEAEFTEWDRPTGWCRCINGALANGLWPEWHHTHGCRYGYSKPKTTRQGGHNATK